MANSQLTLEMALQRGVTAKVVGDRVIFEINLDETKMDLWNTQFQLWLSENDKNISSGFLRVNNNKKLEFAKDKR